MCGFVIEISLWDKEMLAKYFQQEMLVKMKIYLRFFSFNNVPLRTGDVPYLVWTMVVSSSF